MPKNHGFKNGIISGIFAIAILISLYLVEPTYIFHFWLYYLVFPTAMVFFMVLSSQQTKYDVGGYPSFKQLIRPCFSVVIMTKYLFYTAYYILFQIDKSLPEKEKNYNLEYIHQLAQEDTPLSGMIDKQIEMIEQADFILTIPNVITLYLWSVVIGFIFALVVALVIKKKRPEQSL